MTPMTVRGLPRGLQRDAWWMAADAQSGVGRGSGKPKPRPIWLLVLLVVCADILVMRTMPGLGFVFLIGILAGATHWVMRGDVGLTRALSAWPVLFVSLIPAIDVVQFTSFIIAWTGLTVFAAILTGDRIGAAVMRLPFAGVVQTLTDIGNTRLNLTNKTSLIDWALPVGIGAIFAALFVAANPIVTEFLSSFSFDNAPSFGRIIAWTIAALVIWPLLRIGVMRLHALPARARADVRRVGMVNVRSVMRALVVFNVLFAVQTVMDVGFLWGGVRLPEGMTYANYAHRGAYPLMMTALLAGAFALVAQPWLDGRFMRGLLLVWIAQTLLLVMSSILRLDLYVDVYGLTQMRFAAFVWMVVVALGLVVLILQIVGRHNAGWMLRRTFGVGALAVYVCSLTNVTGFVANHQLNQGPLDAYYVCGLGSGATVVIARHDNTMCDGYFRTPKLTAPSDLREWGFRNARLRHTLAATQAEAGA
ncbi:MAG: hypothetical protein ACI9HB_001028 [Gammaproteobacteria bacterium]|jgi:hypothetical protein